MYDPWTIAPAARPPGSFAPSTLRLTWDGDDVLVRLVGCETPCWRGGSPDAALAFTNAVEEASSVAPYRVSPLGPGIVALGDGHVFVVHPEMLRTFPEPLRTHDGVYRGAEVCKIVLAAPERFPTSDLGVQRWALARWFPDAHVALAARDCGWVCETAVPSFRWEGVYEVVARPRDGGRERIDVLVPADVPHVDGVPIVPKDCPPAAPGGTPVVTGGVVAVPADDLETFFDVFSGQARTLAINPFGTSRVGGLDELRVIGGDGRWAPPRARHLGGGTYEVERDGEWRRVGRDGPSAGKVARLLRGPSRKPPRGRPSRH